MYVLKFEELKLIEFETDIFPSSNEVLSNWAIKWLDPEEKGVADDYGFEGYLHSITYPEEINGKMHFSVDFGSASLDSVFDLLGVFMEMGVSHVKMHSNTVINEN